MLKTVFIFLGGTFCGFWFSWLAPRSFVDYWRGSEHNRTNRSFYEKRDGDIFKGEHDVSLTRLADQVRVLCMVMTHPENHFKTEHIKATWGKRCNVLLFFSSTGNDTIPTISLPVEEGENYEWARTKESFKYVHKHYLDRVDWVLKTDDETYVVVENLRYLLSSYNFHDPLYFGRYMAPNNTLPVLESKLYGYMDGKAGFVLSKEATRRFAEEGLAGKKTCTEEGTVEDDLEMGKCMNLLKVKVGNSKDSLGRGRFFPLKPSDHVLLQLKNKSWTTDYLFIDGGGSDCCSDLAITFHKISSSYMYTLEYYLYHLYPYGIRHNTSAQLNLNSVVSTIHID